MREGKGGRKLKTEQMHSPVPEQTIQPHTAGKQNTCALRNPVCHLRAHESRTAADQHWLDFNLA